MGHFSLGEVSVAAVLCLRSVRCKAAAVGSPGWEAGVQLSSGTTSTTQLRQVIRNRQSGNILVGGFEFAANITCSDETGKL